MLIINQFTNTDSNTAIKNHFIINDNNAIVFQSYQSKICHIDNKNKICKIYPEWNYSNTTRKHFYNFLKQVFNQIFKQADIIKLQKTKYINDFLIEFIE